VLAALPYTWLDPLLSGKNAVLGKPPYKPDAIERLLLAVKARVEKALTSPVR
jgi:hypothetical protein